MTELDALLKDAFDHEGQNNAATKFYAALLQTTLIVPIEKITQDSIAKDDDEPFTPLFIRVDNHIFMLAFDTIDRFKMWAGDYIDEMGYVTILGRDLIKGIGTQVTLSLNYGTQYYKEFAPDEITRLKNIVLKLEQFSRNAG